MTTEIIYQGELRCKATHERSKTVIATDAPVDNKGKGAAFSPSDLLAVALGTCIITTIGIKTDDWASESSFEGTRIEVTKTMSQDPRRVGQLDVDIYPPAGIQLDDKQRQIAENIAHTCPVAKSLHSDLKQNITFHW
ncbi:OsmC family protein [Arachidicoccus ginsenosidivorans]|jgi:uncharacterized OsmC-like protein|uniref:OsmC family protein n=1 Tax=Arachidicoccus ginsenosidivorans TaxID=496057 RepID=A0A5B8VIX5_9BACT|nr:OsmC family protein [Arachidicoccus ginsenosidivorans]QEC70536.1 OsmC family protein [Arachidicoccus ginsenosidivorans]